MIERLLLLALIVGGITVVLHTVVDGVRRWLCAGELLARYQARASRSVPFSELWPDIWTDRPYGFFLPEDVGA